MFHCRRLPSSPFSRTGAWACLVAILTVTALQPAPGAEPALDQAFQALTRLELGQDLGTFGPIRQAVIAARTDEAVRAELENRLVAVLRGDATDLGKDYACRQLELVGSDACVPTLTALLPNARMSYMARYALEGIGSPAARAALREALAATQGLQKVGVVISLGRLSDVDAAAPVASLLGQDDAELRQACLVALGRIGTVPAAQALEAFAATCPPALRTALVDARLGAVELLCGRGEHQTAAGICESLLAADSEQVRAAAWRGLVRAKPSESVSMIVAGLAGEEAWKRAVAADCVAGLSQAEDIEAVASAVEGLPAAGKIAALFSLAGFSSPAIREAALKSLGGSDPEVRKAALAALIRSAVAEDVASLVTLIREADDESVRQAAFETLRLAPAEGINQALLDWVNQAGDVPTVIVRCALARRSREFVPAFLKAAESTDPATRVEAFKALEVMASASDAPALVALLGRTASGEQREAADRAVWLCCQQIADPAERSAALLAAMEKGDGNAQCALLPTLARIGGAGALPAVHKAMESADTAVRDAGYRALANWPDATVADELLRIAGTGAVESHRTWCLRAYARVVALPSDRPAEKTFEMLREAMKLAVRPE
ncbi:MAG: HEAT repeat domain-containing protein, partial [Thermoguttaceae bacterium]